MKKRLVLILFLLILSLTGCAQKDKNAKELLLDLSANSPVIRSYTFDQKVDLFFELQGKASTNERLATLQMIPELHIDVTGKQINIPKQVEGDIKTKTLINGREFNYETPYYMKNNNLYFQLPSIITNFMPDTSRNFCRWIYQNSLLLIRSF